MKEKNQQLIMRLTAILVIGLFLLLLSAEYPFWAFIAGLIIANIIIVVAILRWAFMVVRRAELLGDIKDELKRLNSTQRDLIILTTSLEDHIHKVVSNNAIPV
jgi:hypothetical protein